MQRHRHGTAYRLPMTIKNGTMAFVKTQGLFYPDHGNQFLRKQCLKLKKYARIHAWVGKN